MNCPFCQQEIGAEQRFCPHCGAALPAQEPVQPTPVPQDPAQPEGTPSYTTPTATPQPMAPVVPNAFPAAPMTGDPLVVATVKSAASSAGMLVTALFLTLSFVFSLVSSLSTDAAQILTGLPIWSELPYEMQNLLLSTITSGSILGIIIDLLPLALIILGVWLIYAAGKSRESARFSTGGLTLLQVMFTIELVLVSLAAFFVLVCVILLLVVFNGTEITSYLSAYIPTNAMGILNGVLIGVLIVLALAFTIAIVYQAKLVGTVSTVRRTAGTGIPSGKISMFVVIMNFILAGFSLLGCIGTLDWASLATTVCTVGAMISGSVVLLRYRAEMKEWEQVPPLI